MRVCLLVVALALLGTGCGSDAPPQIGTCAPEQTLLSGTGVRYPATMPAEVVDRAACDAANRADVPIETIQIVEATAATWPNSRLGCPHSRGAGATANVEGFRLVVRAGDRTFEYHTDDPTGRPMEILLCGQ